ncbi:hypothetical protein CRN61_03310, partial [Vibrio vulnificus]
HAFVSSSSTPAAGITPTGASAAPEAENPSSAGKPVPETAQPDVPSAENDWGADESTVLRTNFNEPPVVSNPWSKADEPASESPKTAEGTQPPVPSEQAAQPAPAEP